MLRMSEVCLLPTMSRILRGLGLYSGLIMPAKRMGGLLMCVAVDIERFSAETAQAMSKMVWLLRDLWEQVLFPLFFFFLFSSRVRTIRLLA